MDRLTKMNRILLFTVLIVTVLYFGAPFLIPLLFGILLASLMMPFSDFLERRGMNRIFSSIVSTIVLALTIGAILFLFIFQLNDFAMEITAFEEELKSSINKIQKQIASFTNISLERQSNFLQDKSEVFLDNVETYVTQFIGGFVNSLIDLLIVLIYVILFLLYRRKIYDFIMMYVPEEKKQNSDTVFGKINKIVFYYLWGRAQVMALLAVMYYTVFLIFDLPYAVLLLIFGTLITIIPYLGPFVSGLMPIIFAFIFFDNLQMAVLFTVLIISIQLVESYVLEPLIIGKEVKLNPLMVILAVILGGIIWGIAGMVLFVPLFAMVKIISNYSVGLEPIGFLFGTDKESKEKARE